MTVHCPHCLTGYRLPKHLLGDGGARVRCPGCEEVFVVLPEGEAIAEEEVVAGPVLSDATSGAASGDGAAERSSDATATAAPGAEATVEPEAIAGAVLDVLADFLGEALTRSRTRGTVLSDHGPAILAVWDEYRRRAGAEAPSTVFRAALKDRCGVDLSQVNGS